MSEEGLSFARPYALALLGLVPLLGWSLRVQGCRRRQALRTWSELAAIAEAASHRVRLRRLVIAMYLLGLTLWIVAFAGPRWGTEPDSAIVLGRDLVIVLDLSDSMRAEDLDIPLARWQAARDSLLQLADAVEERGGHRLGLIVFAARPTIACPLTTDYTHFRRVLQQLDGAYPPLETFPLPEEPIPSGTRIGAALELAVQIHDPRFVGHRDILLLSDGDDPAQDREWEHGIVAAAKAEIPVHTVGIGDPHQDSTIRAEHGVLLFAEQPIRTRLDETPLRQIAERTRGLYLASQRQLPPVAEFFRQRIEPRESRELDDDALPVPRDRSLPFLGLGLVCVLWGWWLRDTSGRFLGPRPLRDAPAAAATERATEAFRGNAAPPSDRRV